MGDDDLPRKAVCQEARKTVNQQVNKIEMADRKAISLFRTNILLVGLLLTAFSVTLSTELVVSEFLNLGSLAGVLLLTLATFTTGIAYTSSSYDIGISPSFVEETREDDYEYGDFHSDLENEYVKWMKHNERVNKFNSGLITAAIIFVADSIVYLAVGAVIGIYEASFSLLSGVSFLVITFLLCLMGAAIYWGEYIFTEVVP